MKIGYSVTFEFESRAPVTHRGTVEGLRPAACFRRAVQDAQRVLRPRDWTSVVCVLDKRNFGAGV